jgi:hypothetical protein
MRYDDFTKMKRMTATRDSVARGTLDILAHNGSILASFRLSTTGGKIRDGEWELTFAGNAVTAVSGDNTRAATAQVRAPSGVVRISELSVGRSNADITLTSDHITAGQDVIVVGVKIVHAP